MTLESGLRILHSLIMDRGAGCGLKIYGNLGRIGFRATVWRVGFGVIYLAQPCNFVHMLISVKAWIAARHVRSSLLLLLLLLMLLLMLLLGHELGHELGLRRLLRLGRGLGRGPGLGRLHLQRGHGVEGKHHFHQALHFCDYDAHLQQHPSDSLQELLELLLLVSVHCYLVPSDARSSPATQHALKMIQKPGRRDEHIIPDLAEF